MVHGTVITVGCATGGKIMASRKHDYRGINVDGHLKNPGVNLRATRQFVATNNVSSGY
jgi:hypothetical protein